MGFRQYQIQSDQYQIQSYQYQIQSEKLMKSTILLFDIVRHMAMQYKPYLYMAMQHKPHLSMAMQHKPHLYERGLLGKRTQQTLCAPSHDAKRAQLTRIGLWGRDRQAVGKGPSGCGEGTVRLATLFQKG